MKKNLLLLIITLLLLLIGAEVVLRFFPVYYQFKFLPINDKNPTLRAIPNRNVVYSKGWDFRMCNRKNVNNVGFVNKYDYFLEGKRPLIAVVGDSYVEALQVNDDQPFYQILSKNFSDGRIYSFGFSGAGLSQYLSWIKYTHDTFKNDYLVINVVGNDFDESLQKYKFTFGSYYYQEQSNGSLELVRCDYATKNNLKLFIKRSALIRYLVYNLGLSKDYLSHRIKTLFFSKLKTYIGNKPAEVDEMREMDSYRAIDAFLRDLPNYSGLQPDRVLIVLDGLRPALYGTPAEAEAAKSSYVGKMNRYLLEQAQKKGYNVLDLTPVFTEHYEAHHQRFEFLFDGHWNALGHEVVAGAIEATDFWKERVLNSKL